MRGIPAALGYAANAFSVLLLAAALLAYLRLPFAGFPVVAASLAFATLGLSATLLLLRPSRKAAFDFMFGIVAVGALAASMILTGLVPAREAYRQERRHGERLFRHSLPGDLQLFLNGFDKASLRSFDDLIPAAEGYQERWAPALHSQGFSPNEARAISLMLFASTLWAYGNTDEGIGCIGQNKNNNWRPEPADFEAVRRTAIGCCNDFAYMLSFLLSRQGFENRYVLLPGHIFNEAKIDGRWSALDANTNLFTTAPWHRGGAPDARVHVFPHPGSERGRLRNVRIAPMQGYLSNLFLIGPWHKGQLLQGRPVDSKARMDVLDHPAAYIEDQPWE
ncbi:MAG TPA: hypothetical protein VEB41_10530 [Burkholderiales bacterium]|nr:hypothetical protein [Burkholderiales bacterium]